jgi:hypothetical protein
LLFLLHAPCSVTLNINIDCEASEGCERASKITFNWKKQLKKHSKAKSNRFRFNSLNTHNFSNYIFVMCVFQWYLSYFCQLWLDICCWKNFFRPNTAHTAMAKKNFLMNMLWKREIHVFLSCHSLTHLFSIMSPFLHTHT